MASSSASLPGFPADEPDRQHAVDRARPRLDRQRQALQQIVEKTARTFDMPIAAVTVIDRDRQMIVARIGVDAEETERDIAFCAHAIHRPGETMVVEDASLDRRFAGNPFVTGDPHIRFYAGKPLVSRDGFAVGTLCIVDTEPREAPANLIELTLLAREVEKVIQG